MTDVQVREVMQMPGNGACAAAKSEDHAAAAAVVVAEIDIEAPSATRGCADVGAGGPKLADGGRKSSMRSEQLRPAFVARRAFKVAGVLFLVATLVVALAGWPGRWIDSQSFKANLMSALFMVGLLLVVFEDQVGVNKGAVMLMVSAAMWTFLAVGYHPHQSKEGHEQLEHELNHGLEEVGSIILFLLPAMGLVESLDHFDGFAIVNDMITRVTKGKKEAVMPILCLMCFFLSAVIDNLTATIVSLKLLRNAVGDDTYLRHSIGGLVVIAANAGGAWSPVGDVTTTMLWLQDKITVGATISWLFMPSFVAGIFPIIGIRWDVQRHMRRRREAEAAEAAARPSDGCSAEDAAAGESSKVTPGSVAVLVLGICCILMVPVLKMTTGLPPYLGMLLALGIVWFVTDTECFQNFSGLSELRELDEEERDGEGTPRDSLASEVPRKHVAGAGGVPEAMHKMELTGLLFFAGVLLAVGALNTAGVLENYAAMLVDMCKGSPVAISVLLGVSSAVIDNVPLVQASINMFADTPADDPLWQLVALAAGTGGSILSVGSIAGVTLMTMEGVGYLWYCRKVSAWATLGFGLGILTYQLELWIFS